MTIFEKQKAKSVIKKTAKIHGVTPEKCRRDMQEAIDEAWANSGNGTTEAWRRYFPSGKKPSVEEFILVLSGELRDEMPQNA